MGIDDEAHPEIRKATSKWKWGLIAAKAKAEA
jgi:hypothetical protein